MGRIPGYFEWDDDSLTPAKKKEGGLHQNLFDSEGNLKGHARFVPSDDGSSPPDSPTVFVPMDSRTQEGDEDALAQIVGSLALILALKGVEAGVPYVRRWWREKVEPSAVAAWGKLKRKVLKEGSQDVVDERPVEGVLLNDPDPEPVQDMSLAEAQARCLAAWAAGAYAENQMRLLRSANIAGAPDIASLEETLASLSPEERQNLLVGMAHNPSSLAEESLAQLASRLHERVPVV